MQVYNTTQLLDELKQQTESFLQKAISEWQLIAPIKLLQQPGNNKWSVTQCLQHLNSYGVYYLPAIEKAIETAKQNHLLPKKHFTPGRLGNYFTHLMEPGSKVKKMKKMSAPKNHRPATDLNSDKVISDFINQQEKMLKLLEQAREVNLEKARVPISIAKFIKLTLGDTFRFLVMHNYRHVLQAERALKVAQKDEVATAPN